MRKLGWIAFASVALIVTVRVISWAQNQNAAQQRTEREAAPSPHPVSAAAGQKETITPATTEVVARTPSGRPVAGVKIFGGDGAAHGNHPWLAKTDRRGHATLEGEDGEIAVAPDGRIAFGDVIDSGRRDFVFGPADSVRLRFTDGRGRPWAHQRVTIDLSMWNVPIKPYGKRTPYVESSPAVEKFFSRRTDARGYATFPKMPRDLRFAVTAHLPGERPMNFEGSVPPGKRVDLKVTRDLQVTGKVVHGPTGKPIPGVKVILVETNDGNYPQLAVRTTTTDGNGRYRFKNLLNCTYSIRLDSVNPQALGWVYSRTGTGAWTCRGGNGPDPIPVDSFPSNMHTRLYPTGPVTVCDFQWLGTGKLRIEFAPWAPDPKADARIWAKRSSGESWFGQIAADGTATLPVPPGTYSVKGERYWGEETEETSLGSIVAKEGETTLIRRAAPGR